MSDLLKKPSGVVFRLEQVEYKKYRVITDGQEIGTIRMGDTPGVTVIHYENDRVNGTKTEIGEAARALFYSKLG